MIVVYDGSFEGFLTLIFDEYKNLFKIKIESNKNQLTFLDKKFVDTDMKKAERVKNAINKTLSKNFFLDIKIAFKSSYKNKETIIARLIKLSFVKGIDIVNSSNKYGVAFSKMLKNYMSESHTLKGFLRFREIQDGYLFAQYKSQNDILEDLSRHFLKRMPKEKFVIYDKNRNKAFISIYSNVELVEIVDLKIEETDKEKFFKTLWIGFYDAISIKERENKKLMMAHMPKKYWKYLPEKNR